MSVLALAQPVLNVSTISVALRIGKKYYLAVRILCKNYRMKRKNAAAVRLGRMGGEKRAKNLTVEERRESAQKAARARWKRTKAKVGE